MKHTVYIESDGVIRNQTQNHIYLYIFALKYNIHLYLYDKRLYTIYYNNFYNTPTLLYKDKWPQNPLCLMLFVYIYCLSIWPPHWLWDNRKKKVSKFLHHRHHINIIYEWINEYYVPIVRMWIVYKNNCIYIKDLTYKVKVINNVWWMIKLHDIYKIRII